MQTLFAVANRIIEFLNCELLGKVDILSKVILQSMMIVMVMSMATPMIAYHNFEKP